MPPRTRVEEIVTEIWAEALGVAQVGVHDNCYDLGGHSLLSIRVINQIEKRLGIRLSPSALILQTVGQVAACCESATPESVTEHQGGTAGLLGWLKRLVSKN